MTTAVAPSQEIITRGLFDSVEVRAVDEKTRTATFVAATENGVETMFGREFLRMSGADLARYRKNPVVLDTHNRFEVGAVVGNAVVTTKNRELTAEVTFAETARAEDAWQLVSGGFVRALSVGYRARNTQSLDEGESSGVGKNRIEGPARIAKEWELLEISVVPVPGDADTLRRSFLHGESAESVSEVRRLVDFFNHVLTGDVIMAKEKEAKTNEGQPADNNAAILTEQRSEALGTPLEVKVETKPLDSELHQRNVMAICPRGLEDVAEQCILEGKNFEDTRKRMLVVHAERRAPVGTTEPNVGGNAPDGKDTVLKIADVSDEALLRSLCN